MIKPSVSTLAAMYQKAQTSPAMEIPMWFVYLSLLVGFSLTIFRLAQKYVVKLMESKEGAEK